MQVLSEIQGRDKDIIDQVTVCLHPEPHSYTGEDLAEIGCHANPLIVARIMERISVTGLARVALPGEFTMRAFLNKKMSLVEAEAVGALIGAKSLLGLDMALKTLKGELSSEIYGIREKLLDILTDIEASFVSDNEVDEQDIKRSLKQVMESINSLVESSDAGHSMFNGVVTTIAGLPNAGKSSLFNAIVGYPRAIVHEVEGTTRDLVSEHVLIKGLEFVFYDTAGIKEVAQGPEQIGIEKTMDILGKADLVLYVVDATRGISRQETRWLNIGKRTVLVINKVDLCDYNAPLLGDMDVVKVSAKYNWGIDRLIDIITRDIPDNAPMVFLERHVNLMKRAMSYVRSGIETLDSGLTLDAVTIDIREALSALNELTGDEINLDVVEKIFSKFCVGK